MGPSLAMSKQPGSPGWFVFSSIVGKRDPACRWPGWGGSQAVEKGVTSLCTDRETEVQSESNHENVARDNDAKSGWD